MRTFTIASALLAATLATAGSAFADEYQSQLNRDAYAVAAQSSAVAAQHEAAAQPLGYAPATHSRLGVEQIFNTQRPAVTAQDQLFIEQGDRGLGSN